MKKYSSKQGGNRSGFSLIELLVVISIIVILAGIVIAALIQVRKGQDKKQTAVTLQNIRLKLEEYKNEHNGSYPIGDDGGSAILYNALSGDYTGSGEPPTGPVYWPELNNAKNPALVGVREGKRIILDGFGNEIRYRPALDENGEIVDDVKNDGDFDLWSVGPDGEPEDINTSGTLDNEQTVDDIWP